MWSWRDDMRRKREPKPRIAMRGSKALRASEKCSKMRKNGEIVIRMNTDRIKKTVCVCLYYYRATSFYPDKIEHEDTKKRRRRSFFLRVLRFFVLKSFHDLVAALPRRVCLWLIYFVISIGRFTTAILLVLRSVTLMRRAYLPTARLSGMVIFLTR